MNDNHIPPESTPEPQVPESELPAEILRALELEPLYQAPVGLTGRVMAFIAPPLAPVRPLATLIRVAAVVLVFFSSWLIAAGDTPALADVREPTPLVSGLAEIAGPGSVLEAVEERVAPEATQAVRDAKIFANPIWPGIVGLALILFGLVLARRWHGSTPGGAA